MALTKELIAANTGLSGLNDEQINAIITLSQNDENTVIGKRVGEIYREMDSKIATITGIQRDGDEKTYIYLERAAKGLKDAASDANILKKSVSDLAKEKERLEKAITEGSTDIETKKALEQTKKDLAAVTKQFTELKTDYDKSKEIHQSELFGVRVENALSVATSGVKFKSDLPPTVTEVLLQQATSKIKSMNPEYIDDGKGGKTLAFKDETGAIMRNPENQLNPYTATDLLTRELKTMGVLDEGRQVAGTGTQPVSNSIGQSFGSTIDVSGAKTRVEANKAITTNLLSQGLTIGSDEFDSAMTAAWKDNNVSALPEK